MKPPKFDYFAPGTVAEALALLVEHGEQAKVLAGGQSLVPALNLRLMHPAALIDIGRIAQLRGIGREADGSLRCGAMTTHHAFETSALAAEALPLAHAVMPLVAHPAIRTRGTIGGSLAHADPAADWPALCLATGAELTLQGPRGSRTVPIEDFLGGMFTTALGPDELLTAVRFPAWRAGRRWGHRKMTRRRGDFAIVGVACTLELDDAGCCRQPRIAVYGASDRARLAGEAMAALAGRAPAPPRVEEAAALAAAAFDPPSDLHASSEFRKELITVMTRRALGQALGFPEELQR